jgi:hypothetical protein
LSRYISRANQAADGAYAPAVRFSTDDVNAVLRKTVEQLQADLSSEGYALPAVGASGNHSGLLRRGLLILT